MKKMLLVGRPGSGKTSLVQVFHKLDLVYKKTQAITYNGMFVDSPGEFLENRRLHSALLTSSLRCDIVGLVQDSTSRNSLYPPKFAQMFNKPVVGIVTKVDKAESDPEKAERFLTIAGVEEFVRTSAVDKIGIEPLSLYLL